MNTIEEAARRITQLRTSGVDTPSEPATGPAARPLETVSDMSTSIEVARSGYGFALLPEDKIRNELRAGTLKELPIAGSERYAELYLIFADRERAGPGAQRLAEIIREMTANECAQQQKGSGPPKRRTVSKRPVDTSRRRTRA